MTSDLTLVRRTTPAMYRTQDIPLIGMYVMNGKFILTKAAINLIGIKDRGGIMFGFNKAERTAYVTLDNEPDAFMVTRKDEYRYRFCSIVLRDFFMDVFDLKRVRRTIYYFDISKQPNEKGFHQITLKA